MSINKQILVAGVVRNGSMTLFSEINSLKNAFAEFEAIHWLIIESDSDDETLLNLAKLRDGIKNFSYKSMGRLAEGMRFRTERLAHCRNIYLQELENKEDYKDLDYVAVVDLDGANNHLSAKAVATCFIRDDWDVCTANQSGNYYDIWALRHPIWCPIDPWEQYRFLTNFQEAESSKQIESLKYAAVYSKMIHIPANSEWIEVNSAFGGLAIYRRQALIGQKYIGLNENGIEICEHISLHQGIRNKGGKIFINPGLINTDFTDHSEGFRPKSKSLLYI